MARVIDLIKALQEEIEGEEDARDSYEPNTLAYEYHDGRADGLKWALDFITPNPE